MDLVSAYLLQPLRSESEAMRAQARREAARSEALGAGRSVHPEIDVRPTKPELLALMSHELRTPLNAIIGFSELLMQNSLGEAKRREYTVDIHDAGYQLLSAIDDAIEAVRIEFATVHDRRSKGPVEQAAQLPGLF